MLIKKNFQGEMPANKIMGTYTESDTDTYNCNYINNQKSYFWATPSQQSCPANTSSVVAFGDYKILGDKLRRENNYVIVGKGVNQIKISGLIGGQNAEANSGLVECVVQKNDGAVYRIYSEKNTAIYNLISVAIPTMIMSVKEGDKINFICYPNASFVINSNYKSYSYFTIETI